MPQWATLSSSGCRVKKQLSDNNVFKININSVSIFRLNDDNDNNNIYNNPYIFLTFFSPVQHPSITFGGILLGLGLLLVLLSLFSLVHYSP